ncbi:C39 family peptidase [Streptomyces sp. NPDC057682]|uniref:C39 family peptidase n=1 Tax=Streptomyces sp. NPDC057682 TaxID=3346210 RepID=UPI0036866742
MPTKFQCCTEAPGRVHSPVPPLTQYASPDLIDAIAHHGHDPADDPAWANSGAPTQQEYARWAPHLCGLVCMQMALLHRDWETPTLWSLREGAARAGAYEVTDGRIKGLIYAPFVEYAALAYRMPAAVHPTLSMSALMELCETGRMVMASVSKDIRTPNLTPSRKGGHLVLVRGICDERVYYNNPSGHSAQARKAVLPLDTFERFFGGRGVSLDTRSLGPSTPPASTATGTSGTVVRGARPGGGQLCP